MIGHKVALAALCLAGLTFAASAQASCVSMTPAQQRARAAVIFDGVALDGATATGVERFRVLRYRKGAGPRIIRVRTGQKLFPDGSAVTTSVSIDARRGQTWRIFARRIKRGLFVTTVCDGSRRLR